MHLSNEIRLCSNQGHASATQVAIFRVMRTSMKIKL